MESKDNDHSNGKRYMIKDVPTTETAGYGKTEMKMERQITL
jgi:hypothetical protein